VRRRATSGKFSRYLSTSEIPCGKCSYLHKNTRRVLSRYLSSDPSVVVTSSSHNASSHIKLIVTLTAGSEPWWNYERFAKVERLTVIKVGVFAEQPERSIHQSAPIIAVVFSMGVYLARSSPQIAGLTETPGRYQAFAPRRSRGLPLLSRSCCWLWSRLTLSVASALELKSMSWRQVSTVLLHRLQESAVEIPILTCTDATV